VPGLAAPFVVLAMVWLTRLVLLRRRRDGKTPLYRHDAPLPVGGFTALQPKPGRFAAFVPFL